MKDVFDKLKTLETTYKWLNGAKKVADSTKLVLDCAKSVNDMAKDAKKGGKTASIDVRKLEKTLGIGNKELKRLNEHWIAQAKAVNDAAAGPWPMVRTDAKARFESLLALEKSDGADSRVFDRALDKTIKHLSNCHERVKDRATCYAMFAEKADAMHDAFMDANEAIDQTFTLLSVAAIAFQPISGGAASTAVKGMIGIKTTVSNRPKSVARAYKSLADAARSAERVQKVELAELDALLKKLGEMKFIDLLRDARDYLKSLVKAA
jgi:hypothetical protein